MINIFIYLKLFHVMLRLQRFTYGYRWADVQIRSKFQLQSICTVHVIPNGLDRGYAGHVFDHAHILSQLTKA